MYNVSIVIPHYNCPKLLEKLLDTIPEQEDIQTIVVDDNSTKELQDYELVKRKYAARVEFYSNTSGVQSAGACRNIGLDYAKGRWLMFADADDFFLPHMYSYISKYFYSDNDMIFFCPTSIFIDTGKVADRHILQETRIREYLLNPTYENLLNVKKMKEPWSKLIRRSIVEENKIRFSETLHNNDMFFSTVVSYFCSKIVVCKENIYCVTRNQGSLTTKMTDKAYDLHIQEFVKCYNFAKEKYDTDEFQALNMSGGFLIFKAFKRKIGIRKIMQTLMIFRKNGVPLLSRRLRNPIVLYKTILLNNQMVEKEKKYYVQK